MSKFEVRVNGEKLDLWESISVSRSIDTLCATFSIATSNKPFSYPVKLGDKVQILINNLIILTGYVEQLNGNGGLSSDQITISGRDITCDIVDSSLPEDAKNIEGAVTLINLCQVVIAGLNIPIGVLDQTEGVAPFSEDDLQAGASGGNAFQYLEQFARKRQVYLQSSNLGDLIIFRPGEERSASSLTHKINDPNNNVKTWNINLTTANRFGVYVCRSQDNVGFNASSDYSGDGNNRNGQAVDQNIRDSRYLEIIAEETMNDSDCVERAKEESNIRRSKGLEYSATVAGAEQIDGSLWDIGKLVRVDDDFANINGIFLIKTISYSHSLSGTETNIVVAQPDAYNVQDVVSKKTSRKAKIGERFTSV
jgi:prophage tail gpP-like protein